MAEGARGRILTRLRRARTSTAAPLADFGVIARKAWPEGERYPRLRRNMEAVKTEFLESTQRGWPSAVRDFMASQGLRSLAYGPDGPLAERLREAFEGSSGVRLVPYGRPVEELKTELFDSVDAGFTTTRGGIAETGGLLLWPSPGEPRLLSLVPPVHLALLDARAIYDTFWEAIRAQGWASSMPANALIVSGPSKTADIEQTLAYGVHGPKRLVVIALLS